MPSYTPENPPTPNQLFLLVEDLKEIFGRYLPEELKSREKVRILSVACGFAAEGEAIRIHLPNAYYEAMDISDVISGARQLNKQIPPERFRQADATNPINFGEKLWDMIILRNPQVGEGLYLDNTDEKINRSWKQILNNSFVRLNRDGYLFITSCSDSRIEIDDMSEFYLTKYKLEEVAPPQEIGEWGKKSVLPIRDNFIAVFKKTD